MYRVLIGKMAENKITRKQLADYLNLSEKCVSNKINGVTDFDMAEAKLVRAYVAPNMTLDDLFSTEDQETMN